MSNHILNKIKELEAEARKLEPNSEKRKDWNQEVIQYGDDFLDTLLEAKTYVEEDKKGVGILDIPIQEEGVAMQGVLAAIKEHIDSPGLNPASGGHLGYIPGGGIFPSALGDYLAAITNRYAGVFFGGPGAVRLENHLIRWMCQLMGYPDTALGNLTSGGSIANLIAIATARDAQKVRARDIERSVIYLTRQVHHSIQKAIRIAGLSEAFLRYVPVDDRFRMDAQILKQYISEDRAAGHRPFLLVASAGTTDTGAIDPLNQLAEVAKEEALWFHIDAAYGGFFILCEEVRSAYAGIEQADSITIDPHKGLFLAYGSGAVLIKDVKALQDTHYYQANYMQDTLNAQQEPSPADLSPELTKHFRGLRMWLPLQLFGLGSFRASLSEKLWLCRYFYEKVQQIGFEVGPEPELSVMIYRYLPSQGSANDFNAQLVEAMRKDGRLFISSTNIDGIFWLRLAILCFRSHLYHIDLLLQILKEKVVELEQVASA